jgi:hypothetical protein
MPIPSFLINAVAKGAPIARMIAPRRSAQADSLISRVKGTAKKIKGKKKGKKKKPAPRATPALITQHPAPPTKSQKPKAKSGVPAMRPPVTVRPMVKRQPGEAVPDQEPAPATSSAYGAMLKSNLQSNLLTLAGTAAALFVGNKIGKALRRKVRSRKQRRG